MYNFITPIRSILTLLMTVAAFQLFAQGTGKDTAFISRDTVDGEIQPIYIDSNRESKFYKDISWFGFREFDENSYKYTIDYLKENKLALTKAKPVIPWTNWVTLKQYKGSFYAYHPCDFLFHFRQSVNDTTFIDWTGEGPEANKIITQVRTGSNTYEFKLTGLYHNGRVLKIHIIDVEKGIAVFEEITSGTDTFYYLMIAADKIRSVPVIVNYCPTQKQSELEFEETGFEKLLEPE